jgi:hypothetical protein
MSTRFLGLAAPARRGLSGAARCPAIVIGLSGNTIELEEGTYALTL